MNILHLVDMTEAKLLVANQDLRHGHQSLEERVQTKKDIEYYHDIMDMLMHSFDRRK